MCYFFKLHAINLTSLFELILLIVAQFTRIVDFATRWFYVTLMRNSVHLRW